MEHRLNEFGTDVCQIQATFAPWEPLSRILRRFLYHLIRRGARLGRAAKRYSSQEEKRVLEDRNAAAHEFQEGQLVRAKSLEGITATLDASGRTGGCKFTSPMIRYCGREFRVLKRMTRFFDEAQWKMVRCKKLVLLEGVYCDGSGSEATQGCDRMCFVFWREEWLEPVE
jgi:hypothetical protein